MRENDALAFVGRFQPFHCGHLELVELIATEQRPLIIGITNPDERDLNRPASNPHRHLEAANPFSYFERVQMISALLDKLSLTERTTIVPFPLEHPTTWQTYIPRTSVQVVRVFSSWETEKMQRLSNGGYRVREIQGNETQRISGTDIRQAMANGEPWQQWLPEPVAAYCSPLVERLRS